MPVGVSSFIGTVSIDWGGSSAAAVLAMAPIFVLGLAVQRFLVRGLTMGAVKG
jgi:multiple sugar transport system permease protein